MSIEALPNELLVKIFSHFRWKTLRDRLSLVNRRWYQVIGMAPLTNKATLKLSQSVRSQQPESNGYEDICIPLDVLCNSSREYSNFSCAMHSMNFLMMQGVFGPVLDHCHQRWNMSELRITSRYGQFILLMQHYGHIFDDVVKAHITVKECAPEKGCFEAEAPADTHFVLSMRKLIKFTLEYEPWSMNYQSPPCYLSFVTPNLESLTIRRCVMRNNVHLTFNNCSKIGKMMIFSKKPLRSWNVPDPVELDSILLQSAELSRVQLINCVIVKHFSTIFGNLKIIVLAYVTIVPTDGTLECLNLTELVIRSITLRKPLKLRVPQLLTLTSDCGSLKALHLEDAFNAVSLVIDWFYPYGILQSMEDANPMGLSSFRRLHLRPWQCHNNNDDVAACWLWPYLGGISEIKMLGNFNQDHFNRLKVLWQHCPRFASLRMQGMTIPGCFNFLPASVQSISIEDCSTEVNSIEFPPSVTCVKVSKLRKQAEDDGTGISLLPLNRYAALEPETLQVQQSRKSVSRMVYSTRDCNLLDNKH